jgi:hypothetical protein
MQYSNNYGYMKGDSLTILRPNLPPQAFIYNKTNYNLKPEAVKNEAVKRAKAHRLLPWILYQSKAYKLE